jgi:hypothetical protein
MSGRRSQARQALFGKALGAVVGVADGAVLAAVTAGAATAAGALVGKVLQALRSTSGRRGKSQYPITPSHLRFSSRGQKKQEPQSVVVEAKEEPQSLPVEQQSLLEAKEEPQAQLEVKEEELWAQLEVGLQGPPPSPNRQILSGWQQVLPPPPPLPTGNYFLDKCCHSCRKLYFFFKELKHFYLSY